jgi:hypothetical protein
LNLSGNPLISVPFFLKHSLKRFSLKINDTPIRSLSDLPYSFIAHNRKRDLDTGALHPESLKKPWEYFAIPPNDLAQKYADDPDSLSDQGKSRLKWEGGYLEREIIEGSVSENDPILASINNRLRILSKNGDYYLYL